MRELHAKGAHVTVLVRDTAKAEKLFPGVTVVAGDTDKVRAHGELFDAWV